MDQKFAVVTGSSAGIGLAIAKKLMDNGYFVFLNGRREYLTAELPSDRYMYIKADLSVPDGVARLTDAVLSVTDSIDCLVLNAGATCRKDIGEITYEDWQLVMDTNVNMPFFLVQKLLPHIKADGSILFISSMLSQKPHATSLPYGVSKAAVNALVQNLVKSTGSVRVNCICPGFVETDWQLEKPEWLREKIASKIALKRFATPEEIADMCVKTICNTYINGAVINIDGGYDME